MASAPLKVVSRTVLSDDFMVDRTQFANVPVLNTCPQYHDMEPRLHDIRTHATLMEVMDAWRGFARMPRPSKEPMSFWARLWECLRS